MEIRDQWTEVQGLRVRCLTAGESGSPVLLLHGGGTDSATLSWGGVIAPLAAAGHRVFAPDLPGYGESARPDIVYNTAFYLGFVGELMAALGLGRAHLAGLSLGGGIALGTALARPECVDRLVLVDAYGIQRGVAAQRLSYLMVRAPGLMEATWALVRRSRAMARASLANVFHDVAAAPPALIDQIYAEAQRRHAGRAFTSYQRADMTPGGLRTVFIDRLGEIRAPTLLIHGRYDRGVPLHWAEEAQRRIAGSRLVVIENAGHWPQREQPAAFEAALLPFLADGPLQ